MYGAWKSRRWKGISCCTKMWVSILGVRKRVPFPSWRAHLTNLKLRLLTSVCSSTCYCCEQNIVKIIVSRVIWCKCMQPLMFRALLLKEKHGTHRGQGILQMWCQQAGCKTMTNWKFPHWGRANGVRVTLNRRQGDRNGDQCAVNFSAWNETQKFLEGRLTRSRRSLLCNTWNK